jgi:hypothetical protein
MKSQSEGNRKYLALLPVVFLLLNAFFFEKVTEQIKITIMNEKRIEVENHVRMLAAAVEQDKDRPWINHEQTLIKAVNSIEERPAIFACMYKRVGDHWNAVSAHSDDIELNPFTYSEFRVMIAENESGSVEVPYARDGQKEQTWCIYFQYLPMYKQPENRYLVVTGISEQSVATTIPMWVSAGQWGSTIITFMLNIILVMTMAKHRTTERRRA